MARKASPSRSSRGKGKPAATLNPRVRGWLERHPGANNPRSKNYDPNWHQRARGHKPAEHVTRAERSVAAGQATSRDRQYISRLTAKQAKRNGRDAGEVRANFNRVREQHGMAAIEGINKSVNTHHRLKRERVREWVKGADGKRHRVEIHSGGDPDIWDAMLEAAAKYDLPVDYFWYH